MQADLIPARRYEARPSQRWRAECSIRGKTWLGTVHDFNTNGAFFQPEVCLTNGERIYPEDAWMVAGGREKVVLRLTERGEQPVFEGSVRWSGCSDVHRVGGLGLAFER